MRIECLERRDELVDELTTLAVHHLAGGRHHLLPHTEQLLVRFLFGFQQRVALLQCLVVSDQCLQVFLIVLRNHHIHEAATLLTSTGNELCVRRRHHNQWNKANVVRKAGILLLVALEHLLLTALHATVHLFHIPQLRLVKALDDKKILVVHHVLRIDRIRSTLAEREVIHRIEEVSLPHSVLSDETVHFGRERQVHLLQVFIIQNRNLL